MTVKHLNDASNYLEEGKFEGAVAAYRRALEGLYQKLGDALAEVGDLDEAAVAYTISLELNPECGSSHYQLGETLAKLNRVEEAIAAYRSAAALKPDWAQAYFSMGNALEKLNCGVWQMDEAMVCWLRALSLKPDWPELQQKIELAVAFMQWQPRRSHGNGESSTKEQFQFKGNHPLAKLGIRFVSETWIQAIGHFRNLEIYAKMVALGWMPNYCCLLAESKVVNACYLNYWRQQGPIKFICDPHSIELLSPLANQQELRDIDWYRKTSVSLPNGQRFFRPNVPVEKQWEAENRPPLLTLSDTHREQGWHCLQALGVPKEAWFVSLHVREDGFYNQKGRGAPRNADIDTYLLAINTIAARGGWVIRTGAPSMKPLPATEHALDYALCDKRSDWMDVFLWAECRLFLGTTSGPIHIPPTFGVPVVMTNSVPMSHAFWLVCGKHSLFIPKLAWSVEQQRYLTFAEHLQPPVDGATYTHQLDPSGIKMVDNTPEEINDAVMEMLELLEGKSCFTAEDEALLQRLNALSPTYQAYEFCNRMGRDFLRKYAYLLPD